MKKFNCPVCGKELIRLEPFENGVYEFWCDDCNIDISITKNDEVEEFDAFYYDVVASICNETCRTDSHLICGGFNSVEEAVEHINTHNISEEDYYKYCRDDETAYIEIEKKHSDDGSIYEVITVD